MLGILALASFHALKADILSSALLAFPAQTESVEYDNLSMLRRLPNYAALRQRFSGKPLDEAKATLAKLGIEESQVHEVVLGTSSTTFYGVVGGTFSESQAAKTAQKRGLVPQKVGEPQFYCPKGGACVLFLEDALAAFGTAEQLKLMLEARQGIVTRLSSNRSLMYLMDKTDRHSPVRGIVYGSQLNTVLADALQDQSGLNLDWKSVASNIRAFGYSVSFDAKAHVGAILECKSATTAALVKQMLGAMGSLQTVAAKAGKDPSSMPFQNMQVSASGTVIELKMDTPIPAS